MIVILPLLGGNRISIRMNSIIAMIADINSIFLIIFLVIYSL